MTYDVRTSFRIMFADTFELLEAKAVMTKNMWLKQVRCPVNDWLRENITNEYQIWEDHSGIDVLDIVLGEAGDPKIVFKFADASDAMRFKLTWG